MSHELDAIDNISTLMRATANYVYSRIHNKECKRAYAEAMKACLDKVEIHRPLIAEGVKIEVLKNNITQVGLQVHYFIPPSLFNRRLQEQQYHAMAVAQALEIVDKVYARFATGTSDSDPRMFKNKGGLYVWQDSGLF